MHRSVWLLRLSIKWKFKILKRPLNMFIKLQNSIKFHLSHHKNPQPCWQAHLEQLESTWIFYNSCLSILMLSLKPICQITSLWIPVVTSQNVILWNKVPWYVLGLKHTSASHPGPGVYEARRIWAIHIYINS